MDTNRWSVPAVACSPRICRIRDHRIEDHDRSQIPLRDRIYREEFAKHPEEIAALRFARGFSRFLMEKKIHLNPYSGRPGSARSSTPSNPATRTMSRWRPSPWR